MRASSFWSITFPRVLSTYAVLVFILLWVGFIAALALNREWLDLAWNWVGGFPPAAEITFWLLFLPIMVGLWIWESSWPIFGQLMAAAGIVIWTILAVSSFLRAARN